MPKFTVNGSCVCHKTITDECRRNRGTIVNDIVMDAVREALFAGLDRTEVGLGFKFHVVVTIERPHEAPLEEQI